MLASIQKDYAIIDKAAGEFLGNLTGTNIAKDITLAAEMGGLTLLRASKADLSKYKGGNVLLGAIPDETYEQIDRFIAGWAATNGLDTTEIKKEDFSNSLKEHSEYFPQLTKYENGFYEICRVNGIKTEYFPYVAISAAMRLVLAGDKMKLLNGKIGRAIVHYHVICGSKTVPYPVA